MKTNPHFQGLRTSIFRVTDLEKAKTFYAQILGVQPYFDEPFYVGFEVAGYELGLQPDDVTGEKADNVLVYWGVNDIHSSYDRMIALGANEYEKPNAVGGDIWVAGVKDAWGNVFSIIQNPHFSLV